MKKLIRTLSVILALVTVLSSLSLISAFALKVENYYLSSGAFYGDVDDDLKITVKDATAIQKHLAKITELERKPQLIADVDGNGKLSISDATDIQKYLANIIHCFEVEPTEYCEADGEGLRVELTTEEPEKITVKIPQKGYYRFMSRKVEGGTCSFTVYDGVKEVGYAYSDSSVADTYIYLSAGRYTVSLEPSWEYEKDVADFSVTSAGDKMPFDLADVIELNDGDKIEVKAGESKQAYKINYDSVEDKADMIFAYTDGEDCNVSFECYNSYMHLIDEGSSDENGNISTRQLYYSCYLVVTQEEGGSDFTLCCSSYMNYVKDTAKELSLDTTESVTLSDKTLEGNYYTTAEYKFTPEKDGYYKLTAVGSDNFYGGISGNYYYDIPEAYKFTRFDGGADEITDKRESVEYLEAGVTYCMGWFFGSITEGTTVDFTLTASTEEDYNAWYAKAYPTDASEETFEITDYTDIALGGKEFVTISSVYNEDEYWYDVETRFFRFTADKDMTVVAYTEGSYDACAYVYNADCEYISWANNSGDFSNDFTVVIDLKAGESCYFELSSNDCYDYDDYFYFSVLDINDYEPIS